MSFRSKVASIVATAALVWAAPAAAQQTLTLDWDTSTWAAGSLTQSYGLGAGNVNVSVSGDVSRLTNNTPELRQSPTGGLSPAQSSLVLEADYASGSEQVVISFGFTHSGGVRDLSFSVFDIDANASGNPQDQITVTASDGSATFVPTITPSTFNTVVPPASLVGLANVNVNSPDGNGTFVFSDTGITTLTIIYRYPGTAGNPATQSFALHDITFTEVATTGNQPPVAVNDTAQTGVNQGVTVPVLANDSDPDGGPVLLIAPSGGSTEGGTLSVNDNGTPGDRSDDLVNYTPPTDYQGVDTFSYQIEDDIGDTDTATVTVTVADQNGPTAVDDSAFTAQDTPVNIDVLANDFDARGPVLLNFPSATSSEGGSVVVNDEGTPGDRSDDTIDYTPPAGFTGTDTFFYPIEDLGGQTDEGMVTVTVQNVTAPVASDDMVITQRDQPVNVRVLANDFAPGGSPLLIPAASTSSQGGSVVVNDEGTPGDRSDDSIDYTPPAGFDGVDTFNYTIEDGGGQTDSATVTISVLANTSIELDVAANPVETYPGGLVAFSGTVRNRGASNTTGAIVEYALPPGFTLATTGAALDGMAVAQTSPNIARFSNVSLPPASSRTLTFVARVGAGVSSGEFLAVGNVLVGGQPSAAADRVAVRVAGSPDFGEAVILGRVFHDTDGNGRQDPGEEGVAGVRVATVEGLLVETDRHGRFHLAGIDTGPVERGRNFVMKVDSASLPAGATFTTENPRVRRVTAGLPTRFDFGVRFDRAESSCCRVVETKLGEIHFHEGSDAVWPEFLPVLEQLAERLRTRGGGVLVLSGASTERVERVRETLGRLLGDSLVRNVEVRNRPTPVPDDCSESHCPAAPGYDVELLRPGRGARDDRVDLSGRFSQSFAQGGHVRVTEDPLAAEPRLALRGPEDLEIRDGRPASAVRFHVSTNYARFIDQAEILIYAGDDVDLLAPIAVIPVRPSVLGEAVWNGASHRSLGDQSKLLYRLRAWDAEGRRDETALREIRLGEEGLRPQRLRPIERGAGDGPSTVGEPVPLGGNYLTFEPPTPVREATNERKLYTLRPTFGDRANGLSAVDEIDLDAIVSDARDLEGVALSVSGHTDSSALTGRPGDPSLDRREMTEERARVVARYLAGALKLTPEQVRVTGKGADEPLASNFTKEGRDLNNRIEVRIEGRIFRSRLEGPAKVRMVNPASGDGVSVGRSLDDAAARLRSPVRFFEADPSRAPEPSARRPVFDEDLVSSLWDANDLARREIPVHGSRVRVLGEEIPGDHDVSVSGTWIPVDSGGRFAVEEILPVGRQDLRVNLRGPSDQISTYDLPIEVRGKHLFYVALADLTVTSQDIEGSVEPLAGDERFAEDTLLEGRVAFYVKGKIKGRYLLTARLDTTEEELDDLLGNLDEVDREKIFRRLDPDRYYPVYGDDSTTIADAESQGRLYVRLEWDKSDALLGNYHTGLTGNEFAQYNRSLFGARYRHRSLAATERGESRTEATVFVSEPETALGHSEFLATGGSLYYLRHRNLLPGSDKARIEIRDRDSGRVLETVALVRGADYEVDELEGRLLTARPLQQIADMHPPSLIRDQPLDGNRVVLLVDYEYVPEGLDEGEATGGLRAKGWVTDRLGVGATYVHEGRGDEDYSLYGGDLVYRAGEGSYVKVEYASSEESQTSRFFSDNGGLTFDELAAAPSQAREGAAYGVEARANLQELTDGDSPWTAAAWWRSTEAGFSVARRDLGVETTEYGVEVAGEIGERVRLAVRGAVTETDDSDERQRFGVQTGVRVSENGTISAEVRQVRDRLGAGTEFVEGTLGAVQYRHRVGDRTEVFVTGQATVDDSDGAYEENDLGSFGARIALGERLGFAGEIASGDRGDAARLSVDYGVSERHQLYGTFTHSIDRPTAPDDSRFTLGQRSRISDQTTLFTEHQFVRANQASGLARVFGLDYTPRPGWDLGLSVQSGDLQAGTGAVERDAIALSAGYRGKPARFWTKVELRSDDGAEQRDQWVASTRLDWKIDEGLRFLVRFNGSTTDDELDPTRDAKLLETSFGLAYRPPATDRFELLSKYTILYDLPSFGQIGAGPDQRSNVLSFEGVARLGNHIELTGKLAGREAEVRLDRAAGDWTASGASFGALRLAYHWVATWDALVEYRLLDADDSETTRAGYLVGVDRHFGSHFKLGLGYNFTDFSDDLTDLDYDHNGVFVNFVTKY